MMIDKDFGLDTREASELIGLPEYSIRKLCREGGIPFYKSGNRRYFSKESLIKWVHRQENKNWKYA